jgi:hypothetical protein
VIQDSSVGFGSASVSPALESDAPSAVASMSASQPLKWSPSTSFYLNTSRVSTLRNPPTDNEYPPAPNIDDDFEVFG